MHGRVVLARDWAVEAVREAVASQTLYEWAAAQPSPDLMRGRGISYGVDLPAGATAEASTPVVVRRNRHGGLLRFLTGEHFLLPTRAPLELETALRLMKAGIPTPEVVACVVYPVAGLFGRSDVMTRRLPKGDDLPAVWRDADDEAREALLSAVGALLTALAAAGAWHADLNLKNIYIAGDGGSPTAYLLDVDRVTFPRTAEVAKRNYERLARSARKWRERWGLDFSEEALTKLASLALEK
ncbi:lipopolysaccharide kinase InaA family protein [Geomonas sp.]|uniref:lipopolysaccharide kinase InaA family protein n=1 Tax=Geomonas sp. TaxID=2651584 RepID=UPI002B497A08|nr:lipopolysaccharide kinase InaA family protein [Geomonas sp.]HJV35507.1 lipopolysaccharide kinase InaA family protein [Geomonas sp.]